MEKKNSKSRPPKEGFGGKGQEKQRTSKESFGGRAQQGQRPSKESLGGRKQEGQRPTKENFGGKRLDASKPKRERFERQMPEDDVYKENRYEEILKENQLEGRNAILEVLKTERDVEKIWMQKGIAEGTLKRIAAMAKDRSIVVQEVAKQKLDAMSQTKNHQGVIALVSAHAYAEVADILQRAKEKAEPPFVVVLDEITDPHNLGAVLRSAECAGAHGVIIPRRRAVGLTPIVGKTSAGAVEHIPVARVTNLVSTLEELKKAGLWIACADMDGEAYFKANLTGPIALVIGNEGEGVGRLVKETCDFTVSMPMYGKISSLNASVAAGLLLYEVVRQRHFK